MASRLARRTQKIWLIAGAVSLGLFVALGLAVTAHPLGVDLDVASAFQGVWRGPVGRFTNVVSDSLGIVLPNVCTLGLVIAAVLCGYRRLHTELGIVLRVLVVFALCRLVSVVDKPLFLRARPRAYADFAYPSGHVVAAASTGLAAVLLCVWLVPRAVGWTIGAAAVITVVVAVTRLVLGVHWLTDTVGAVLGVLGVGLAAAAAMRLLPGPVTESARAA